MLLSRFGPAAAAALLLVLFLAAAGVSAHAKPVRSDHAPEPNDPAPSWHRSSDSSRGILVRFKPQASERTRRHARGVGDVTLGRRLGLVRGLELVRAPKKADVDEVVRALEEQPGVLYAEPDPVRRVAAIPNDPRFGELWGLHNTGQAVGGGPAGAPDVDLDAVEAWDIVSGGPARVAVIDTGIAFDHPDLAPNIFRNPGESGSGRESNGIDDDGNGLVDDFRGWDFANGDNDPGDDEGHGTHVSGTIAARGNNGIGTTGVAWNASLLPIKAGAADGTFAASDIIAAYAYAAKMGARVVNASFGGYQYSQAERDAIAAAGNMLFVAAAGNEDNNNDGATPSYPCSYPLENVVCVGAVSGDGSITDFSNYGTTSVDLAAPGRSILSQQLSSATVLQESFDDGAAASRWLTGALLGSSTWSLTGARFVSASRSLADSPAGNYASNQDTYAVLAQPFSLSGKSGCWVDYRLHAETEADYDIFYVEGSTGGDWSVVDAGSGSTGGEFIALQAPLGNELANSPSVRLRFGLATDSDVTADGVYVDDIAVRCPGDAYTGAEAQFLDGTSMAAPHVSGVAALVLAQWPEAPVSYVRRALLGSVTVRDGLRPWVATGGIVNARDALDDAGPAGLGLVGPRSGLATADSLQTLTWNAPSDAESGLRRLQLVVDGQVVQDDIPPAATQTQHRFADGLHGWTIRAVDNAGNTSQASPATITVDSAAPTASFASGRMLRRLVKRGRARLPVRIDEAASVRAQLLLNVPRTDAGRKRRIKLRGRASRAAAGKAVVRFRLSQRQRRWVKRATAHVRRFRGSVAIEVTDQVENRTSATKRARIKVGRKR